MTSRWPEVEQAASQNRHELVLSGAEIASRVEKSGLDEGIFRLADLNFLELSRLQLTSLPDSVGAVSNLTSLVLHNNCLTTLNPEIGKLVKLQLLDISCNKLETLPEDISQLVDLYRLNVSGNMLTSFPNVSSLVKLHQFDFSHNQLNSFPDGITNSQLQTLSEIHANANHISELPDDFSNLPVLKVLDVSDNNLTALPGELSECGKLREFRFAGNKYKDRRLLKMMEQSTLKAVLEYLRANLQKEQQSQAGGKSKAKKTKKSKGKNEAEIDELATNFFKVLHFPSDDSGLTVQLRDGIQGVRPYIVCVIVRDLNMKSTTNMFKRFITVQTKLHDGICQKRVAATIATHDLTKVKNPLTYEAKKPSEMLLIPLFKQREVSADKLVAKLRQEAEELRKEKKRNTFSGIHKYLDLIHGKPCYPCLVDTEGTIISFPPITNCDVTKISQDTKDILIEVTSSTNLDICKKVMDELLKEMLEMGLGAAQDEEVVEGASAGLSTKRLVVEQVRILDITGHMKVVYPSRTDLPGEGFKVIRDYE